MKTFFRLAILALAISAASAFELQGMTVQIDRPREWDDPYASHHLQHAVGGAIIAPMFYAGFRANECSRGLAGWGAWGSTTAVAFLYEVHGARANGCWLDLVDVAWSSVGAAVSTLAAYSTDRWVIAPLLDRRAAGLSFAVSF